MMQHSQHIRNAKQSYTPEEIQKFFQLLNLKIEEPQADKYLEAFIARTVEAGNNEDDPLWQALGAVASGMNTSANQAKSLLEEDQEAYADQTRKQFQQYLTTLHAISQVHPELAFKSLLSLMENIALKHDALSKEDIDDESIDEELGKLVGASQRDAMIIQIYIKFGSNIEAMKSAAERIVGDQEKIKKAYGLTDEEVLLLVELEKAQRQRSEMVNFVKEIHERFADAETRHQLIEDMDQYRRGKPEYFKEKYPDLNSEDFEKLILVITDEPKGKEKLYQAFADIDVQQQLAEGNSDVYDKLLPMDRLGQEEADRIARKKLAAEQQKREQERLQKEVADKAAREKAERREQEKQQRLEQERIKLEAEGDDSDKNSYIVKRYEGESLDFDTLYQAAHNSDIFEKNGVDERCYLIGMSGKDYVIFEIDAENERYRVRAQGKTSEAEDNLNLHLTYESSMIEDKDCDELFPVEDDFDEFLNNSFSHYADNNPDWELYDKEEMVAEIEKIVRDEDDLYGGENEYYERRMLETPGGDIQKTPGHDKSVDEWADYGGQAKEWNTQYVAEIMQNVMRLAGRNRNGDSNSEKFLHRMVNIERDIGSYLINAELNADEIRATAILLRRLITISNSFIEAGKNNKLVDAAQDYVKCLDKLFLLYAAGDYDSFRRMTEMLVDSLEQDVIVSSLYPEPDDTDAQVEKICRETLKSINNHFELRSKNRKDNVDDAHPGVLKRKLSGIIPGKHLKESDVEKKKRLSEKERREFEFNQAVQKLSDKFGLKSSDDLIDVARGITDSFAAEGTIDNQINYHGQSFLLNDKEISVLMEVDQRAKESPNILDEVVMLYLAEMRWGDNVIEAKNSLIEIAKLAKDKNRRVVLSEKTREGILDWMVAEIKHKGAENIATEKGFPQELYYLLSNHEKVTYLSHLFANLPMQKGKNGMMECPKIFDVFYKVLPKTERNRVFQALIGQTSKMQALIRDRIHHFKSFSSSKGIIKSMGRQLDAIQELHDRPNSDEYKNQVRALTEVFIQTINEDPKRIGRVLKAFDHDGRLDVFLEHLDNVVLAMCEDELFAKVNAGLVREFLLQLALHADTKNNISGRLGSAVKSLYEFGLLAEVMASGKDSEKNIKDLLILYNSLPEDKRVPFIRSLEFAAEQDNKHKTVLEKFLQRVKKTDKKEFARLARERGQEALLKKEDIPDLRRKMTISMASKTILQDQVASLQNAPNPDPYEIVELINAVLDPASKAKLSAKERYQLVENLFIRYHLLSDSHEKEKALGELNIVDMIAFLTDKSNQTWISDKQKEFMLEQWMKGGGKIIPALLKYRALRKSGKAGNSEEIIKLMNASQRTSDFSTRDDVVKQLLTELPFDLALTVAQHLNESYLLSVMESISREPGGDESRCIELLKQIYKDASAKRIALIIDELLNPAVMIEVDQKQKMAILKAIFTNLSEAKQGELFEYLVMNKDGTLHNAHSSYEWVAVWRDAYPYSGAFRGQLDKHYTALREQVESQPQQKFDEQIDLPSLQSKVDDDNDDVYMVVESEDNYYDLLADDDDERDEELYDIVNVTAGGFFDEAKKQKGVDTQLQNKSLAQLCEKMVTERNDKSGMNLLTAIFKERLQGQDTLFSSGKWMWDSAFDKLTLLEVVNLLRLSDEIIKNGYNGPNDPDAVQAKKAHEYVAEELSVLLGKKFIEALAREDFSRYDPKDMKNINAMLKSKNIFSKGNCDDYNERMKPEVLQQAEKNISGNQARSLHQCGVEAQHAAEAWQKSMAAGRRDEMDFSQQSPSADL